MVRVFEFPYRTVCEISIRALIKNLSTVRGLAKKEVIPVVKADAYGHGMVAISKALVKRGCCQMLAVATLEEALELREQLSSVCILVLSGFLPHQLDAYLKFALVPMIHSIFHLKQLLGRKPLPQIHLKLDTGMGRLGVSANELSETIKLLNSLNLKLSGVATHLAESENLTSPFIGKQLRLFEKMVNELKAHALLNSDAKIHLGNSGAILRQELGISNAVRPGLCLYGISPNPRMRNSELLLPVMAWRTRVLALKNLKRGDSVGYNRTYLAKRQQKIALLPIGYADGFPRLLSNKGEVLIGGKRCPIRGIVSMDLTAIGVPKDGIKEGSLVTLFGRDGKNEIAAWDLAHWAQTIPYEIFCGISQRVPRIYTE